MMAPTEKVRAFLIKYQDRVLYGTDLDLLATADVQETIRDWESTYIRDWNLPSPRQTFEHERRPYTG